jgi:hypothetical protein
MKKRFITSGLILTTLSSLCADDLPPSTQGREAIGLVNPSSRYQVEDGWNMFLNTEFLWWVAKEDGLYYAQSGYTNPTSTAVGTVDFNGRLEKVTPDWHPGFRIGFGGNMSYDEWDILLNWTWFRSNGRDSTNGLLLTLWGHPDIGTAGDSATGAVRATGKWHLLMNLLDLEMGRAFWVGKHFALRPFFGVRGAWIDQSLRINYHFTTTPITTAHLKPECDFEGGGVRAGLDARFTLFGGWSFYGLASAAMMYGFYDCDFRERWESVSIAVSRDKFHAAASTGQLALGVRWDTYVHHDRYHFGLYAGWEQNIWFGLNKMNHWMYNLSEGILEQMNGDLMLQGGTFGVRFDY